MSNENLYALLIGVNYYFPNILPNGGSYGHLHGCVNDVVRFESYLKTRLGLTEDRIVRLTASHGNGDSPAEVDPSVWPTYENIVNGFKRITELAEPGDQVVVHYSGHGGRAATIYPADIKTGGIDEALVPTDIGLKGGRYLRDLELVHLLNTMSAKGLVVSVILDSCHSGGMTRGDAVARGIDEIDLTPRPVESLAAPDQATLLATWQGLFTGTRAATPAMFGGLPESNPWVILTACRPQELAYESSVDDAGKSGALTYCLLDALQSGSPPRSFQQVHQRVMARVQARFPSQRPQLYGDGARAVFGRDRMQSVFAVPVLEVGQSKIVLNGGVEQGIYKGARLAVFPPGAADLSDFEQAIAFVTTRSEDVARSVADVDERIADATIEPGAPAVLYHPGSIQLRSRVALQMAGECALPLEAQEALRQAHLADRAAGFVEWAEPDEPVDFTVETNALGEYQILDAAGELVPRINPPLMLTDETAAAKLIDRLIHLTRYRNVWQLANSDSRATGLPEITFEWQDVDSDHVFTEGDEARVLVRNDSKFDVEIALLELAPDWRVTQVYPGPEDAAETYTFAPGESDTLEFEVYVEDEREDEETSIYKVFSTVKGVNFRVLELPSLDEPVTSRGAHNARNELESLLAQVVETVPATRAARLKNTAVRQWITAQVELRVCRRA